MALSFRYNWMGPVGTVSQAEICNSSRLEPTQRTKDMDYRRKVARKIRENMNRIKRDLGLADAAPSGGTSANNSPPRAEEEGLSSDPIVSIVDQSPAAAQPPALSTRTSNAAKSVSNAIRNSLIRSGVTYTSFIDGSVHEGLRRLNHYNSFCLPLLQETLKGSGAAVPSAEQFSTVEMAAAVKEETVCRIALDAARKQRDLTYMSSFVPPTPSDSRAAHAADTPFDAVGDDEYEGLELVYKDLRQRVMSIRETYNQQADAYARSVFKIAAVRSLDLSGKYRAAFPEPTEGEA
jgi:hypothetical protein